MNYQTSKTFRISIKRLYNLTMHKTLFIKRSKTKCSFSSSLKRVESYFENLNEPDVTPIVEQNQKGRKRAERKTRLITPTSQPLYEH